MRRERESNGVVDERVVRASDLSRKRHQHNDNVVQDLLQIQGSRDKARRERGKRGDQDRERDEKDQSRGREDNGEHGTKRKEMDQLGHELPARRRTRVGPRVSRQDLRQLRRVQAQRHGRVRGHLVARSLARLRTRRAHVFHGEQSRSADVRRLAARGARGTTRRADKNRNVQARERHERCCERDRERSFVLQMQWRARGRERHASHSTHAQPQESRLVGVSALSRAATSLRSLTQTLPQQSSSRSTLASL